MTTAIEVITLALKDVGVIADGETASPGIAADAFATLQHMLAMWQIDGLYVYANLDQLFYPTGAQIYTVGVGGTANITRPERITFAFWRDIEPGGIDYPITLVNTFKEYRIGITQKILAGQPEVAFYDATYPLGTLYVYPQPSTGSIHLGSLVRLPALSTSADTLTLPAEYIMPIRFSLAELLAATFNSPINAGIPEMARRYRTMLKRNNVRIPELQTPAGLIGNIFSG